MQRNLLSGIRPLLRSVRAMPRMILSPHPFEVPSSVKYCKAASVCGKGKLSPKMAKIMRQYQKNDGKPVFLKGGSMDVLLYRLTLLLCVIGLVGNVHLFFGYILA